MNRPGQVRPTKTCPVCNRTVKVRDNGKFSMHRINPRDRKICPGSEKKA